MTDLPIARRRFAAHLPRVRRPVHAHRAAVGGAEQLPRTTLLPASGAGQSRVSVGRVPIFDHNLVKSTTRATKSSSKSRRRSCASQSAASIGDCRPAPPTLPWTRWTTAIAPCSRFDCAAATVGIGASPIRPSTPRIVHVPAAITRRNSPPSEPQSHPMACVQRRHTAL